MPSTLYFNSQCSKCRATKELLDEHGEEIEVIEYLKSPPNSDELQRILELLGMSAHQLVRAGDAKKLGLDYKSMSEGELIEQMTKNPIIIQRPILISNGEARIGRPPETVLEII
jgi:arsenate reductase (glutaredoxin)